MCGDAVTGLGHGDLEPRPILHGLTQWFTRRSRWVLAPGAASIPRLDTLVLRLFSFHTAYKHFSIDSQLHIHAAEHSQITNSLLRCELCQATGEMS